jgi:N-acetylmuramoyl-L-alanine amidase
MAEVMSSGHGAKVSGASDIINEVKEARKVVKQVVKYLKELGETVYEFHDDTSTSQNENLRTIVRYHNSKKRDRDFSVHFNAGGGEGTEVLHYGPKTKAKAAALSKVISNALGTKDRGPKERPNLYFLNSTEEEGLLLEICFVDSKEDVDKYRDNFDKMCRAIAEHIAGKKLKKDEPVKPAAVKPSGTKYQVIAGTFTDKKNAENMADKLKKAGFDSYVK